jgi:hypothetical protein
MFEEDRKYYSCITCGVESPPGELTREHLFGKTFVERIRANHKTSPWLARTNTNVIKGSSSIFDLAPRLLCKKCNGEILGKTMEKALPSVLSLYGGGPVTAQSDCAFFISRYFERMGVMHDVMTSNFDLNRPQRTRQSIVEANSQFRRHPPLLSEEDRFRWLGGDDIGIEVYLGRHHGVLGLDPYVNVYRAINLNNMPMRDIGKNEGKRFTYVIGKMVIVVQVKLEESFIPDGLCKISRGRVEVLGGVNFGYKDIFGLQAIDLMLAKANYWFADPVLREIIESDSRAAGRVILPPLVECVTPQDVGSLLALIKQEERAWPDAIFF